MLWSLSSHDLPSALQEVLWLATFSCTRLWVASAIQNVTREACACAELVYIIIFARNMFIFNKIYKNNASFLKMWCVPILALICETPV